VADLTIAVEVTGKDSLSGTLSGAQSGLGKMVDGLGKFGLAAMGAQTAISTVVGGVQALVGPAVEAQQVSAKLNAVLASTQGVSGMTAESIGALSTSLSRVTQFEDDAITSAQSLLLTFTNIGKDVFPQATETILNMSEALGQDLSASSMQLGKALNDPIAGIGALRRVGVQLTDEQENLIKSLVAVGDTAGAQRVILGELETQFGGAARAAGETLGGQLAIAQNQFGELIETIGTALLPVLTKLMTSLLPVIDAFAQWLPGSIETLQPLLDWLVEHIDQLIIPAIVAMGVVMTAAGVAMVVAMGPIVLAVTGVGLAIAALTALWTTNWGDIQGKVEAVWGVLEPIFGFINAALDLLSFTKMVELWTAWSTTWTNVQTKLTEVWNAISLKITETWAVIEKTMTEALTRVQVEWDKLWLGIQTFFATTWDAMKTKLGETLQGFLAMLGTFATDARNKAVEIGTGIMDGMVGQIVEMAGRLKDAMVNAVKDMIKAALDWWDKNKPTFSMPEIKLPGMPAAPKPGGIGGGAPIEGGQVPPGIAAGMQRAMASMGSQAWNGLCEKWIGDMFGSRRYPTAWADALANTTNPRQFNPPPGQLVFFRPDASNQGAGHVGVSLGGNKFLSATAAGVKIDDLGNSYWSNLYHGFGPPRFAQGVRGFGGGLAIVGERGWELASLPRGSNVYPHGESQRLLAGAGGVQVHFHGPIYGFDEFEDRVVQATERAQRRGRQ
jgi:Prophage tail length tape measure protein/NlpC/P60 family